MESSAKEPWHKWARNVVWEQTLKTLVTLAVTALIAWIFQRSRSMPNAVIHPAEYWLGTGALILFSLAGALSIAKAATWGVGRFKRWRHPHSLELTACSGDVATIEIKHHGEPAKWEMRMRILKVKDSPNPDPLLRRCFLHKDGDPFLLLPLNDGASASLILAEPRWNDFHTDAWMMIKNAEVEYGTRIGSQAVVEVNISATPPMRGGILKRCFLLARVGSGGFNQMHCSDAPCE
jgi:hypothetical protein